MQLKHQTALVFGGSGAIGSAVAHALARDGAHVYLGARDQTRLDATAESIRAAGGTASTFIFDALHGTDPLPALTSIDVVVNATGFMHDQGKRIDELTLAEFRQGFDPFLTAYFNIAKAVSPKMGAERRLHYHCRRTSGEYGDAGPSRAYRGVCGNRGFYTGARR
jgi:NAD(P)-dependent dehydrogenase (short-subunit alcohol dehydrogenase family)